MDTEADRLFDRMTTRTTAGEIQLQSESVGHSGHSGIDRNLSGDGGVKDMIIGVGKCQFMRAYG